MQLTLFKNIFDNKTNKGMEFADWDAFSQLLYSLSTKPGYKPAKGERTNKASPLISPAVYKLGIDPATGERYTRANRNVVAWAGWAALDVDEYDGTFKEAIKAFEDYYYICYSTASSTEEHPKFRIVFPLTEYVMADKIKHFWFALNKEFLGLADAQTKDLSRMYYIPALYPNAHNFIFTHKGEILQPNKLMASHEYVPTSNNFLENLPEGLRNEIIRQRKSTLTNDSISWSSYRDCPFVRDELVMEYSTLTDGRYRFLYKMMSSIAAIAIKKGYPLTAEELETLIRQIDRDHQSYRFEKRPILTECNRALSFIYSSM